MYLTSVWLFLKNSFIRIRVFLKKLVLPLVTDMVSVLLASPLLPSPFIGFLPFSYKLPMILLILPAIIFYLLKLTVFTGVVLPV